MRFFLLITLLFVTFHSFAQRDTAKTKLATTSLFKDSNVVRLTDSTPKKMIADTTRPAAKSAHDPRKATFRSAVLPGWGQAYNHDYWKIPIVYGALAIPASVYVFNNNYYRWTKFAYEAVYNASNKNADGIYDSTMYFKINKKVLSSESGQPLGLSDYQSARNNYKRNKDYSLLWFLILWGVNVADATVFGHLKEFDVSDDLTLQVNPSYIPATKSGGISLVFNLKNQSHKPLPSF